MKKIILLLLIATMSLTAFSAGLEVRGGFDASTSIDADDTDMSAGYVVKVEYLVGEGLEFGGGVAYKQFGNVESDTEALDGKSFMTSTILYGTTKLNLGESGFSPYLRANVGYAMNSAGDYFTEVEEVFEAFYIASSGLITSAEVTYEVSPGLYYGVAAGFDYNNILIEVSYDAVTVVTDITGETNLGDITFTDTDDAINIATVTLEVGYKFGAGN